MVNFIVILSPTIEYNLANLSFQKPCAAGVQMLAIFRRL